MGSAVDLGRRSIIRKVLSIVQVCVFLYALFRRRLLINIPFLQATRSIRSKRIEMGSQPSSISLELRATRLETTYSILPFRSLIKQLPGAFPRRHS